MGPEVLGPATASLPAQSDPRLLVGFDLADDAGVVRLSDTVALVQTVDFFTPVVDDPYMFGAIAASNALSDVYAMGGIPVSALNILCWNDAELPPEILHKILLGGLHKVLEAGAVLAGGHSVSDSEVKYGLAVTGTVHPDKFWTNAGAQPGDQLVLTKPLGTGIITTAGKRELCTPSTLQQVIDSMAELNRTARDAAALGVVHAATDITGFGLVGHAWEVAAASRVRLHFQSEAFPLFPDVVKLVEDGHLTRGETTNRTLVGEALHWGDTHPSLQSVLVDPQTSGGLLLSVPSDDAARLVDSGVGSVVGEVHDGEPGLFF